MATILIIDDDSAFRDSLAETVTDLGHRAVLAASGAEALTYLREGADVQIDAVVLDLRMPGNTDGLAVLRYRHEHRSDPGTHPPITVLTAFASAVNTIEAMRLGAFDHLTKPIGRDQFVALIDRMLSLRSSGTMSNEDGSAKAHTASSGEKVSELIGSSEPIRRVQKAIGLATNSDTTVLILGETGTGKELVARALHRHDTKRQGGPFSAVNCAAIPADLLESELFGHTRGAFSGATADRGGAFREAHGGTLFLDEIGDMPLAMQAKILRTLQERVVVPIGGRPERIEVRIVAATHRDLPALVQEGRFREDLYYRLNVFPITIPPLRARPADILPLAEYFLHQVTTAGATPKRLSAAALTRLLAHPWPGNVRELKNTVERASVLARGATIDAGDLDFLFSRLDRAPEETIDWLEGDLPTAIARLEAAMIRRTLLACDGNRAEAARRLGIHRQLLYDKIKRLGLGDENLSDLPTPGVRKADT